MGLQNSSNFMPPSSFSDKEDFKKTHKSSQIANIITTLVIISAYGCVSTGLIEFNANFSIFAVMGALTYLISLIDPRYGLAAIVVAFSLSPDIPVGSSGIKLRLEDFLIPAVGVCWFLKSLGNKEGLAPTLHKKIFIWIAFIGLISTLLGLMIGKLTVISAVTYYFKTIEYMFLFLISLNIMKTRQDVLYMLLTLLLASTFVGFFGAYQAINLGQSLGYRVSGPSGETANILGGYYTFCMLLAAGLFFCTNNFRVKVLLFLYFSIPMLWPLMQTYSRAGFVSLIAALTVLGILKKQRILLWVAALMILIPLIFPEDVYDRLRTVLGILEIAGEQMPSSFSEKVVGWQIFWHTNLSQYPILGTGVGSINLQIDNEYLKILGETGIVGLGLFAWMIVASYRLASNLYRSSENKFDQGLTLGYIGAMTALLFQGVSGTVFTTMRTMEPFILLTAMITVLYNIHQNELGSSHSQTKSDGPDNIPPIGHYTLTEIFRQRYRSTDK